MFIRLAHTEARNRFSHKICATKVLNRMSTLGHSPPSTDLLPDACFRTENGPKASRRRWADLPVYSLRQAWS